MNDSVAIRTANLTKAFKSNVAVDGLNVEVRTGELFGLVGPDGAGKTTVMRLLTAIMRPTYGNAWIQGYSILNEGEKIKDKIGYMSARFGLYEDLTVMENIHFYADIYGVKAGERFKRIERLLAFSRLEPFTDRLAGNLSGGMKQKLGLVCALIHTPEVLFLDEPTSGVDPVSRRDFWHLLYDLLKEKITIFVSTAYLDEAERCTTIAMLYKGKLLAVDKPSRIRGLLSMPMMEITGVETRRAKTVVSNVEGVLVVTAYGDRIHVGMTGREVREKILRALEEEHIQVQSERYILPSLEDVFIARLREEEGRRH